MVIDPPGLRRPMHAQRDRAVVLRLVDHDVAVGERGADQQRVGLVDQELVGDGPLPTLATRRPGSRWSTTLMGCCVGHALFSAAFSAGALAHTSSRS